MTDSMGMCNGCGEVGKHWSNDNEEYYCNECRMNLCERCEVRECEYETWNGQMLCLRCLENLADNS